jgi:hypothetical protein
MTLTEVLDIVVSRTRHERYRWLCSDANPNTEQRDAYRRLMFDLAGQRPHPPAPRPEPPRPALAATLALMSRMRACPHRTERTDCGCAGMATCGLGRGLSGLVNHHDCLSCLSASSA